MGAPSRLGFVALALSGALFAACSSEGSDVRVSASGEADAAATVEPVTVTSAAVIVQSETDTAPTTVTSAVATTTTEALRVAFPSSTTTTRVAPTTTTTAQPTVTTTAPADEVEGTTTTTIVCRDSLDARCGPFYWDPKPENAPLVASLSVLTVSPAVGEPVEFKVVASDDSHISRQCYDGTFGNIGVICHSDGPSVAWRYGPWSPPTPIIDRWEGVISHVYAEPGTYTVTLTFRSGEEAYNPYGSTGSASVTVTVAPRAAAG